ncbi:MAG: hypothetical protein K8I82_05360 [Anaerolineae bacterium]|nr:hypothetical protein [Anaerolineae bacterium]
MSDTFLTPQIKTLLWRLQLFLATTGLLMFILGTGRVLLEVMGGLRQQLAGISPDLFTWYSLGIGVGLALVGYGALYAAAAVGSREPPALTAARTSLLAVAAVLLMTTFWLLTLNWLYMLVMGIVTLVIGGLAIRFWQQMEKQNLWQVFGQPIHRQRRRKLIYILALLTLLILGGVGVAHAVLTDVIELPIENPESGELLYTTTFDTFNDEWDLPQGSRKADTLDGELVLTLDSGKTEDGFYSLLESRKFRDFNLRVTARQVAGDDDNAYGVVFRQRDRDTYYVFEISGDGWYRLKMVEDNRATNITQWMQSPAIHQGQAANEIRIVGRDDTFTFYVNQELMRLCTKGDSREPTYNRFTGECDSSEWQESFKDDTFPQGYIGLSLGNTRTSDVTQALVVAFDNLVIIGPANE